MPDFGWPLLVIGAGLVAPFAGSLLFVRGFDRFKRDRPDEWLTAEGREMARAERQMWGLPIGALIVGPALIVAGTAWLLWVLLS